MRTSLLGLYVDKIRSFAFCFLLIFGCAISKAFAIGTAGGAEPSAANSPLALPITDHISIGGDGFSKYYDSDVIKDSYGARGTLRYKLGEAEAFGTLGVQRSEFDKDSSTNYKTDTSPIYGFGIGYNLPLNFELRLNQSYFKLEKNGGQNKNFNFTDLTAVLVF